MPARIRVCHIMSGDLWAGAEVQVATVASYLTEQPEVTLTAVLLNEGWLSRELRRIGVDVTIVDERKNTLLEILSFLVRFFRHSGVDIVHTHRYKENILGSVAATLAGVPHVIRTVHLGMFDAIPRDLGEPMRPWDRLKSAVYEGLDKTVLRCFADRIVTVSRCMAEALQAYGYDARTATFIHNGVDLRRVKATHTPAEVRRELGIDRDELIIGTAGRLSPVKGHAFLLRAAKLILEHDRRVRFVFLGAGPLKSQLLDMAADLKAERACLFVDRVMDLGVGIYDVIAAMDIFALPSLDEGVPMALLEAMALARPVVATPVGGVPEIVTNRVTGLLVPPKDEQRLADACLELVRHREWAQTLGENARRLVETEFSRERNGQAWLDLYHDVAADSNADERNLRVARANAAQ
jgi:glycosyltransferase involved in cell wall biosynthesis